MPKRKETVRLFELKHQRKTELKDWLVIEARLDEVICALSEAEDYLALIFGRTVPSGVPEGPIINLRSNFCFAAITYVRCFSPHRKPHLDVNQIPKLTEKDHELHESIRELRNRQLAHPVSDENGAIVYLSADAGGDRPSGFAVVDVVTVSQDRATVTHFAKLATKVKSYVHEQVVASGDEVARSLFGPGARWANLAGKLYVASD